MKSIEDTKKELPRLKNDEQGSHFQQNNVVTSNNNNVINIYVVYKLDPIASSRNITFTIQNALFGAMQITKNADTSKYDYKGYGICFDEGGQFGHTITEQYMLWIQNLYKVLMILRYMQKRTFTETLQTQVKNLC